MLYNPTPQFVTIPQPGGITSQEPTALYQLQEAAAQYINDYTQFTAGSNTAEYASPAAFTQNLISFAQGLCNYSWSSYTCQGFDPVAMGQQYAQLVFQYLKGIILPSTGKSVYDTWVAGPPTTVDSQAIIPAAYKPGVVPGVNLPTAGAVSTPQSVSTPTPTTVVPQPVASNTNQGSTTPTGMFPTIQQTLGLPQTVADNVSQSQIAAQGGAPVQVTPTPASANVLTSISSMQLPFGLTWTQVGFGLGILVIGYMMAGSHSSGRRF